MKNLLHFLLVLGLFLPFSGAAQIIENKPINFMEAALLPQVLTEQTIGNKTSIEKKLPQNLPLPTDRSKIKSFASMAAINQPELQKASPIPAASFNALDDNGNNIPPDVMGCAGPNHLMVTLNSQYRIMNKVGTIISTVAPLTFWSGLGATGAGDPHVRYDVYLNRWIMVAQTNLDANSSILVAMSQTNDPTGTWNRYRIDVDAADINAFDYPYVAFNQNWVVITGNMFSITGSTFVGTQIYAFDKANLSAGGAINFTTNAGKIETLSTTQGSGLSPATVYESGAPTSTFHILQNWNGGSRLLRLTTLTGSLPAISWNTGTAIFPQGTTAWASGPPTSDFTPQLGDARKLNSGDARLGNTVLVNGNLWVPHTVFLPNSGATRSAIQWWKIQTTGTVLQNGLIDDPTSVNFRTYPSIAVNNNEDVAITYCISSAATYASAAYSFRRSCDAVNTMQDEVIFKNGVSSYYKTFSANPAARNRWGDYTFTSLDPSTGDFWLISQYAAARANADDNSSRWGTWWAKITPPSADNQINWSTPNVQLAELGTSGPVCPRYTDYTVKIGVACAATGAATININTTGTATNGADYSIISPTTVNYTNGDNTDKTFTIRVFDDANIEPDETIQLTYAISGGTGVVNGSNQTLLLTIKDNDIAPNVNQNNGNTETLLSENFNAAAAIPAGWLASSFSASPPNVWTVSANGGADFPTNCAHITNNTTTRPNTYTNTAVADPVLISRQINGVGYKNLKVSFTYKSNGEAVNLDYGRLMYSFNGSNFFFVNNSGGTALTYQGVTTATPTGIIDLPASLNNTNFFLGWRWTNNANSVGSSPAFTIDDVVVTGIVDGKTIETTAGSSIVQPINATSLANMLSTADNEIILSINNASADLGCITSTVSQAGTALVPVTTNAGAYNRISKVFTIVPSISNTTATYNATFYVTDAEVNAFGVNKASLKILQIADGVSLSSTLNSTNTKIITPSSIVDNAATKGYLAYTGSFTGFSQFTLADPTIALPLRFIDFTGTVNQRKGILKWITEEEVNNKGFAVEKSSDGQSFSQVGWVNAINSIGRNEYDFIDNDLLPDQAYFYRLKQTDNDDKFVYSKVISLKYSTTKNGGIVLYPNPSSDFATLYFANATKNVSIQIFDLSGRLVKLYSSKLSVDKIQLDVKQFLPGVYTIKIINDNQISTFKLLKQ